MNRNAIIGLASFLVIPLVLIIMLVGALHYWKDTGKKPSGSKAQVVYLRQNCDRGSIVVPHMISTKELEQVRTPEDAYTSADLAYGRVCNSDLSQGSVITLEDLSPPSAETTVSGAQLKSTSASPIAGRFSGDCNGQPMTTKFTINGEDHKLSGSYLTQADLVCYGGTFGALTLKDHELTAMWTDKYGSGPVHFTFNKDFTDFSGTWRNQNDKPRDKDGDWSGIKTEDYPPSSVQGKDKPTDQEAD